MNVRKSSGAEDISEKRIRVRFPLWYVAHEPIAAKDAMKIPDAKAAVDKGWDKLKNPLAWVFKKVKPKSDVVQQAKKDQTKLRPHFPKLDSIGQSLGNRISTHLLNQEFDNHSFQLSPLPLSGACR